MPLSTLPRLAPGLLLCAAVTALALALQGLEEAVVRHPYLEALVLAILIGTAIRSAWTPDARFRDGIAFAGKELLEFAVMLLGASVSFGLILAAGWGLLAGIVAIVAVMIAASYAIGRALRLPPRMAMLIACGNAICGNSAIAAIAPVIGAKAEEVASAIAFTAALGVVVVLALPLLVPLVGLGETQYGILAGLTVYAVPQVLAATAPLGVVATQVGALVKLVRVLTLGPVVVAMAMLGPRFADGSDVSDARRPGLSKLVPWFILGFLVLAALRSLGLVPDVLVEPARTTSRLLTILAMAALGLGVDVRALARAGPAASLAVVASLLLLVALSLALVLILGPA